MFAPPRVTPQAEARRWMHYECARVALGDAAAVDIVVKLFMILPRGRDVQ